MCQCIFTYNDKFIVHFSSLRCVASPLAGLLKSPKAKCSRNYISLWSKFGFWTGVKHFSTSFRKFVAFKVVPEQQRPGRNIRPSDPKQCRHATEQVSWYQNKDVARISWERLSMHIYGILGWSMLVWSHVSCIWLQCGIHTRRIPALCEIYCKSSATVPKRSFTFHSYKEVGVIEWTIYIFPDLKGSSTFWLFGFSCFEEAGDSWMRLQNKLKHPHRLHLLVLFSGLSEIFFCIFSPWNPNPISQRWIPFIN